MDLAYVAAGRASLFAELYLSAWDYAAGMLLVAEAGGITTTMKGEALPFTPASVLAGATVTHAEFLTRILPRVIEECGAEYM